MTQNLRRSRGTSRVCTIPALWSSHVCCARMARRQHARQMALGAGSALISSSSLIHTNSSPTHQNIACMHSMQRVFYSFTVPQNACRTASPPGEWTLLGRCIDLMTLHILFPHHVDQFLALRPVSRVIPLPSCPTTLSHCAPRPRSLTNLS